MYTVDQYILVHNIDIDNVLHTISGFTECAWVVVIVHTVGWVNSVFVVDLANLIQSVNLIIMLIILLA